MSAAGGFKKPNPADAAAPKRLVPPGLFDFEGGALSKDKGANGKVREALRARSWRWSGL